MPVQTDCSVGIKRESAWGIYAAPDQHVEFLDESLKYQPSFYQGPGLRVGSRVKRKSRRQISKVEAGGSVSLEATTKGLGTFLNAALGTVTSTQVPGDTSVYQQVHTLLKNDWQPTYTLQKGIPLIGGAVQPATFLGAQCATLKLSCSGVGNPLLVDTTWMCKTADTSTAYATPTYATASEVLTFVHASGLKLDPNATGFTAPTSTALAIGSTSATNVRSFELTIDNGLSGDADGGYALGGGVARQRRVALGGMAISGTLSAEFTDTVIRDGFMNNTSFSLVLTFTHPTTIGTASNPVLQIVLPEVKFEGDFPASAGGKPVVIDGKFVALDPEVTGREPIYVVYRTLDAAV